MKSNKNQQNNKINSKEQIVQNKTDQLKENVSTSKDGFRYDYDDSSDV